MSTLRVNVRCGHPGFVLKARFELEWNRVHAILGPSGSGKTTLLRAVAGLDPEARGHVRFGDEVWLDSDRAIRLAVHQRRVGFVFQDVRLFSHLSVEDNVLYGRRRARDIVNGFAPEEVIDALGVGPLRKLRPNQLSAGQRQRVAFARAILAGPHLLIMDEPFTALDDRAKSDLMAWVRRLPLGGVTVLYVSHGGREVNEVANSAVSLETGSVVGVGKLEGQANGAQGATGLA